VGFCIGLFWPEWGALSGAPSNGRIANRELCDPEHQMLSRRARIPHAFKIKRHAGSVMGHERFTELIGDIGFDCAIAKWLGKTKNRIASLDSITG